LYGVAVPYAVDEAGAAAGNGPDDTQYQAGATASGADSYAAPADSGSNDQDDDAQEANVSVGAEAAAEPPAVLVFKDGHRLDLQDYAIAGETLYDLSSGYPKKIGLADLDLAATEKMNNDRGVPFELPPGLANQ
jgi:hypothetical protein